jgi:ATP-binding cassette subfamily F protein uup
MTLLTLDRLSLAFRGTALLDEVSKTIQPGQRIGLLGRNGAGKTTLLRLIAGEQEPDDGGCSLAPGAAVAFLPQEVPDDLAGTVLDIIQQPLASPVAAGLLEGWQAEARSRQLLEQMELAADADVATLSAGRKRRVLLARALVTEPDLLLLDEPTNHLDLTAIEWLEKFLAGWQGTLLFITHDRGFLRRMANRIWELDRGRLFDWDCDYDTFLKRKAAALEAEEKQNALFDKRLAEEEVWIRQGIKARRTRNEGRVRALKQMRDQRRQRREQAGRASLTIQEASRSGTLVCEAKQLQFGYDSRPIVSDFSTTIIRGDKIGLVGPNGVGKTTLLRLLLGELSPQAGTVRTGTNLAVRYFDQLRGQLALEQPVLDQINGGNDFVMIDGNRRHVIGYLQDFLFEPERARLPVKFLSGGERNRLLLAKLFAQPANVLVLDEPTNDLDLETLELLEEKLVAFTGTVLVVSHDREFLDNVATSVIAFEAAGPREYVGGYTDWQRQARASTAVEGGRSDTAAAPSAKTSAAPAKSKKLSYKDQRELEQLPQKIEQLEAELAELHQQMADAAFYQQPATVIAESQQRMKTIEAEVAAAYSRWESLEQF